MRLRRLQFQKCSIATDGEKQKIILQNEEKSHQTRMKSSYNMNDNREMNFTEYREKSQNLEDLQKY